MSTRDQSVHDRLAARELGALVVSGGPNVRWLTGFTGSSGLAVVGPGPARHFFTDFRYDQQSADQLDSRWQRRIVSDLLRSAGELLDELQSGRPLRVGFDDAELTVGRHRELAEGVGAEVALVAAGGIVEQLRSVKTPQEVEAIAEAARLADAALSEVLDRGLAGRTERDVALDLEVTMRKAGAEGVAFPPIVASGEHGALPHAEPRDVPIERGVLVTIDWGAQLDGYCSDCTRTFATGDVADTLQEIYALVLASQEAAVAAARAGLGGRELDAVAREVIVKGGYGEQFGHGLGHGVGLEVHESPRVSQRSDDDLLEGQVITIEPGIYVPGLGGVRIEDLIALEGSGARCLTRLPKQLQTIV